MSQLNIRTLLSKSVDAIKSKLGIESFTWAEYEDKLKEAMQDNSTGYFKYKHTTDELSFQLPEEVWQYNFCLLLLMSVDKYNPPESDGYCVDKIVSLECYMTRKIAAPSSVDSNGKFVGDSGVLRISDTGVVTTIASLPFATADETGDNGDLYLVMAFNR